MDWQTALGVVFLSGLLFLVLTFRLFLLLYLLLHLAFSGTRAGSVVSACLALIPDGGREHFDESWRAS